MTTEPLEAPADMAHIAADLHDTRRALGALGELVTAIDHRGNRDERVLAELACAVSRIEQLLTELAPAARRAAAMFESPVGRWASSEPRQPRRERKGRRQRGDDDRTD